MHETVKKILGVAGAVLLLFLLPTVGGAKIEGECNDCHTDSVEESPDGFLWRIDCVSCHALGTNERIVTFPGGTRVPQVFHLDNYGDLAGGNFAYVNGAKPGVGPIDNRKGHDVIDLFPARDIEMEFPPGFRHGDNPSFYFRYRLSCAGVNGCHGIRNQLMIDPSGKQVPRTGMAALKGAHHANEDGRLTVADKVANSYRFLMGVHGLEHTYAPDRWQNVTPVIHNEYYGIHGALNDTECSTCHVGSTARTTSSYIAPFRHTMSGFCATCHSNFHVGGPGALAFLRHPADFIIPNKGEYAEYLFYDLTAPVARPIVPEVPNDVVTPGRDLVMCLTCHVAHGSPFNGILRFDYTRMVAGNAGSEAGKGCFACHTSKGR